MNERRTKLRLELRLRMRNPRHVFGTDNQRRDGECQFIGLGHESGSRQEIRSTIGSHSRDFDVRVGILSVCANLAKVHATRHEHGRAAAILWHALELDPNQTMAVGWFAALAYERGGKSAMVEAWARVAALPGSWRAQLWLARATFEKDDFPRALAYYRESFTRVSETVPTEFLRQMSGDLGIHGRFTELVQLTEPHFKPEVHGLRVGNNLIKSNFELGHLQGARRS